jgi:DNA-binding MarR family transcriptional regulator
MQPPHFATENFVATAAAAIPASAVAEKLLRAADCLRAALAPQLADTGLNETRYGVLDSVRRLDPQGCSQTEVATRLLLSESNLSTLLERMRQDGLIARDRSRDDRRKSVIRLTGQGEQLLDLAAAGRTTSVARLLNSLSDEDSAALAGALGRLLAVLERRLSHHESAAEPRAPLASSRKGC